MFASAVKILDMQTVGKLEYMPIARAVVVAMDTSRGLLSSHNYTAVAIPPGVVVGNGQLQGMVSLALVDGISNLYNVF